MRKLFLLDGVAGTVKNDLIRFIKTELSPNSVIVSKYTTREKRDTDEHIDLIFVSGDEFEQVKPSCYYYPYGENDDGYGRSFYGIPKEALNCAIQNHENTFVIVRNRQTIEEIKSDFDLSAKVVHIFIYSDKYSTRERLLSEGRTESDICARMKRLDQVWMDYVRKPDIYILEPGKEFKREDGSVGTYYEPKKVFDITQTTAVQKIPPKKRYNERVLIKALVNTSPVPVEIRNDLPENVSALYRSEDKVIHIRQGMKGDDIFRALSKEIAHARLDKGDYSRDKCEVAAYGIAFISCARAGIDPADIDRKKNPFEGKTPKDIRQELSAIRDEANSMSQSMSKILDAKNKNRDAR